jgi:Carboxypeptidase regulatory-like domain
VKRIWMFGLVLLLATVVCLPPASAQGRGQSGTRMLTGQVLNSHDAPLRSAVVYLKNTKTLAMKTFITNEDGVYRFPALSLSVDYEVYAELNGKRSDTKVLSSLDSRPSPTLNLRINQ